MTTLYNELFKLKNRTNRDLKEDYVTVIFADCLERNPELLKKFLSHFKISESPKADYKIILQDHYPHKEISTISGIPDMVLLSDHECIFFEHKVNSNLRLRQLDDYSTILKSKYPTKNQNLVLITKKAATSADDKRQIKDNNTIHLRWFEIYDFLKDENSENYVHLPELLFFLKKHQLDMNQIFENQHLNSISDFHLILRMMDESMSGEVLRKFNSLGGTLEQGSGITQIKRFNRYTRKSKLANRMKMLYGYWFDDTNNHTGHTIGIQLEINPKSEKARMKFEKIIQKNALNTNWLILNIGVRNAYTAITKKLPITPGTELKVVEDEFIKLMDDMESLLKIEELKELISLPLNSKVE